MTPTELSPELSARILVVEDDAVTALDIETTLDSMGYNVTGVVSTAEDAVDAASRSRPDLALMDIRLPGGVDGIDAGTFLRSRLGVPVVYLTAHSDAMTLNRAKESGSYGYLVKPFEGQSLHATIEVALYRHHSEELLRTGMERCRDAVDGMTEAVLLTDAEGTVTHLNPAAEVLLGRPADDAVGRKTGAILHLVNEVSGRPLADPVSSVLSSRIPVYLTGRNSVRARGGHLIPVMGSVVPTGGSGQDRGAVVVLRDPRVERKMGRRSDPDHEA